MDLNGIPKLAWRERLMIAYRKTTGNQKIPAGQTFFTLGGPATSDDSELNHLVNRGFITPRQYVSVERDYKTHVTNSRIKGPTWLHGKFERCLLDWITKDWDEWKSGNNGNIAFLNADIMSGIEVAFPIIKTAIDIINEWNEIHPAILAFNVLESNRWAENRGYRFAPVWDTLKSDAYMQRKMREGLTLIDRHTYENKTVGTGSGISHLTTLIFTTGRV